MATKKTLAALDALASAGLAVITVKELAAYAGMTERTIYRDIERLKREGLITVEKVKGTRGNYNAYRLVQPDTPQPDILPPLSRARGSLSLPRHSDYSYDAEGIGRALQDFRDQHQWRSDGAAIKGYLQDPDGETRYRADLRQWQEARQTCRCGVKIHDGGQYCVACRI